MKAGHEYNGRPPMFSGYASVEIHVSIENATEQPIRPPIRVSIGTLLRWKPMASAASSTGYGV